MSHKKDSLWERTVPFASGEDYLWSSCPSCMTKLTDAKEVEQQREWGYRDFYRYVEFYRFDTRIYGPNSSFLFS